MRIGALGADGHEVIYGLPANNFLGLAASVVQAPPAAAQTLPTVPEISLAKKNDQMAASKVGLFAYNRRTKEPIWQSGLSEARSTVDDRWYFGAGPFHRGTIHNPKRKPRPALPFFGSSPEEEDKPEYFVERKFGDPSRSLSSPPPEIQPVAASVPADASKPAAAPAAAPPAGNVANQAPAADKPSKSQSAQSGAAKDAKPTAANGGTDSAKVPKSAANDGQAARSLSATQKPAASEPIVSSSEE
jgi:hypothetical protein